MVARVALNAFSPLRLPSVLRASRSTLLPAISTFIAAYHKKRHEVGPNFRAGRSEIVPYQRLYP